MNSSTLILDLKKQIEDTIAINDNLVCALCDSLIKEASLKGDMESIAFSYIAKANYYYYAEVDQTIIFTCLNEAKSYLDKNKPSELLEKYYTLWRLYHHAFKNHKASLSYALKALKTAEAIHDKQRISANLSAIGELYLEYDCFSQALYYLHKSLDYISLKEGNNVTAMRSILVSIFDCQVNSNQLEEAKKTLDDLSNLKLVPSQLKLYVDRCSMIYYSYVNDENMTIAYAQEVLDDQALESMKVTDAFDFISNIFQSMMRIQHVNKAKQALRLLRQITKENDYFHLLKIATFQIAFHTCYHSKQLNESYNEYYARYNDAESLLEKMKVEGLNAKLYTHETARKHIEMNEKMNPMEIAANIDELTNLYNRRFLNYKMTCITHDRARENIGFILFDIDFFREFNDVEGHDKGDFILQEMAQILQNDKPSNMDVCRYDGDVFICVFQNSSLEEMRVYVENVQSALWERNLEHKGSLCSDRITCSIGYGIHDIPMDMYVYSFIEAVEQALYQAKEKGRNNAIAVSNNCEVADNESKSKQIKSLIHDINVIRFQDLELLKKKCDLLESLAEKHHDLFGIAFSNMYLAHYYQINQRDDDYKFHSAKAKKIAEQNQYSVILVEYYKLACIYNTEIGDKASSFSSCLRGLEIALEAKDYEACTAFNNNIAEAYFQSKVFDQAETYFLRALKNTEQSEQERPKYKDLVLMNLVDVFVQKKDVEKARYWLGKSREYGYDTSLIASYAKRSEICVLVLENKKEEAFERVKELRKDMEKEEPMLFIHIYLYLMDIILEIRERDYADWCLNILMSLIHDVNEKFKLKILTFRIKYSELFEIEDEEAYTKFYEVTLGYKEAEKRMNYESLNDMVKNHYDRLNQEDMMKQEERSQRMIGKDELCNVYNRRYFAKLLTKHMYNENVNTLGVIMIDIDYFKEYNDTYSHRMGDQILKRIAETISELLPENMVLSRFCGDEFACICINKSDEEIYSLIEIIQAKIRNLKMEHKSHRSDTHITLSLGFCNSHDRNNLFEKADDALYKAKSLGRNTYYPRRIKAYDDLYSEYGNAKKESAQSRFIRKYDEARKQKQHNALVLINIKNFRYYNTKYGYHEGNKILFLLHEAIHNFLQKGEYATRVYADNFALLLSYDDIQSLVNERLVKSIETFFHIEDPRIHRNLFLTYCVYEMKDDTISFHDAWNEMNLTRREVTSPNMRNSSIELYTQQHHNAYLERMQLEEDIAEAYKNYEFIPFYQPKVDAKTYEIVGAEVLLRWYDKAGNLVPLYKFLPILNENSYINLIDLYIFETTCQMLDERIKSHRPVVPISFNISKSYFYDEHIIEDYIRVFEKFDIPKNLIEIELMETISLDDTERLNTVIQSFNDYGFKCVLDDFGNGYSSFGVLLNNELSTVKIDRQFFVKNLNGDNKLIIKTVVNLIKSLHMKVVAEGVETKEYADFLAECGCDMIQGYYFYKPMSLKKFYTILNQAKQSMG